MARPRRKPVQILNVWLTDDTRRAVKAASFAAYESQTKWVTDAVTEWLRSAPARMDVPQNVTSAGGGRVLYVELPSLLAARIRGIIRSDRPTDIAAVVSVAVEHRLCRMAQRQLSPCCPV